MSSITSAQNMSYLTARAFHVVTIFFCITVIEEAWRFPHYGWSGFIAMTLLSGLDNGTSMARTDSRLLSVLCGVFFGYMFWAVGHIDYRLLYFILPLLVYGMFFWAGSFSNTSITFTVSSAIVGFGYWDPLSRFYIGFFVMDFVMAAVIGFCVILLLEEFFFKKHSMMRRFLRDAQEGVLEHLYLMVNSLSENRSDWFKSSMHLSFILDEIHKLSQNKQFAVRSEQVVGDEFKQFILICDCIFSNLNTLYVASLAQRTLMLDYQQLEEDVRIDLHKLQGLMVCRTEDMLYGASDASSN